MCSLSLPWFPFPPDSGSPPSPGMAPLLGCLIDLFASRDGATMQSNPLCTKKRLSLCCHTVPSAVTQPQLAQHCFHLQVKVFWKQKCDDLTPLPRTKCTITLNSIKTKASPSQSEEHAVQIEQFKSSTTADYWSEPVITLTPHSAGWWKNEHDGKRFYMLMECGIRYFFPTISSG